MDPVVESALISAAATLVGVGGAVAVAIVGFRSSRSANQATIDAAGTTTDKTLDATRDANKATLDAIREGQLADRYSRAIEQLGADKVEVRIGGIYALERIARDSSIYHSTVMEVLSAFIREQWLRLDPDAASATHGPSRRPDLHAALTVIGRRDPGPSGAAIDLTGADLTRARIVGNFAYAFLTRANLTGADLTVAFLDSVIRSACGGFGVGLADAILNGATIPAADLPQDLVQAILDTANDSEAYFDRATLTGVDLNHALLDDANLTGASLVFAVLTRANLTSTVLTDANLALADFQGANLTRADLTGANLVGTNFGGADLIRANLTRTNFTRVNLDYADLRYADLTGIDLTGAHLEGTNWPGAILTDTKWPADVPVPEGWKLDPESHRLARADAGSGAASTK